VRLGNQPAQQPAHTALHQRHSTARHAEQLHAVFVQLVNVKDITAKAWKNLT